MVIFGNFATLPQQPPRVIASLVRAQVVAPPLQPSSVGMQPLALPTRRQKDETQTWQQACCMQQQIRYSVELQTGFHGLPTGLSATDWEVLRPKPGKRYTPMQGELTF
eukprot:4865264-Amphidinium_carterae.1